MWLSLHNPSWLKLITLEKILTPLTIFITWQQRSCITTDNHGTCKGTNHWIWVTYSLLAVVESTPLWTTITTVNIYIIFTVSNNTSCCIHILPLHPQIGPWGLMGFFISIFNLSLLNFHLAPSQKLNHFSAFRYHIRVSLGGHAPQPHSDIFLLSCRMQWQLKGLMKCEEVGQINLSPCLVVGLRCYWWLCRFQSIFKCNFSCGKIYLLYSHISCQCKGQVLQGLSKIPVIIFKLEIISMHFVWLGSMV